MVIPVEIELPGGLMKLEIGYNQGQNPFTVAQDFIDKHMLDQAYLREIADYITQRAGEYRPPVLGNDDSVNSAPSGTVSNEPAVAAPRYKYFPVVRFCVPVNAAEAETILGAAVQTPPCLTVKILLMLGLL